MRHIHLFILCITLICGCKQHTTKELDLANALNKPLHLSMFKNVRHNNVIESYEVIRRKYKFITVVYLEMACPSCYKKFIEWQNKIDSIGDGNYHTVLFIISGDNYSDFMKEVRKLDLIEDKYYTIIDSDDEFIKNNVDIPRWIMKASMLIDNDNIIRMVGEPWSNDNLKSLFHRIIFPLASPDL
jgi:hypothetical protein